MDDPPYSRSAGTPGSDSPADIERRVVFRLLGYWRGLGDEETLPLLDSVDPDAIPDIWPYCFVLDVSGHQHDPVFRFIGPKVADRIDGTLIGAPVSKTPGNTLLGMAVRYVPEVLRKGVPVSRGGNFARDDGARVLFRSIILPLSGDGVALNYLLGAANSRAVAEA